MDPEIANQLGMGAFSLVAGILGWVLPYKWNILRLRRHIAAKVPEKVNKLIPKIIGTILIVVGISVLIATAVLGKLD